MVEVEEVAAATPPPKLGVYPVAALVVCEGVTLVGATKETVVVDGGLLSNETVLVKDGVTGDDTAVLAAVAEPKLNFGVEELLLEGRTSFGTSDTGVDVRFDVSGVDLKVGAVGAVVAGCDDVGKLKVTCFGVADFSTS